MEDVAVRASSGRSSVWVKKNRSADTMVFMVGSGTPASCCSIWNRRRSSVVAVWGERSKPGREPAEVPDVLALGLLGEPAHGHVVDQALAKWADRADRMSSFIVRLLC